MTGERCVDRRQGLSVRLKFTLSYAGFLVIAGALLLAAVWVFLLRGRSNSLAVPDWSDFLRVFKPSNFGPVVFVPAGILALGFLLVFGLVGGWILVKPDARPADTHHRRHTQGGERTALPPDPPTGPPR